MRRSVPQEEKEVKGMFAGKYLIVPILQLKLHGRVGINTHVTNLQPQ